MILDFVPESAQGEAKQYEGIAKFKLMSVEEKYTLADEIKKANDEKGQIRAYIQSLELIEPLVVECNFKSLESGLEFSSFKDLKADCRNDKICQEMAAFVMQGYAVPKNLNP